MQQAGYMIWRFSLCCASGNYQETFDVESLKLSQSHLSCKCVLETDPWNCLKRTNACLHPPFFVLFVAPFSDTPWLDCHATLLVNLLKDWLFCNPKFIPLYQCNSVADSIPVADPLSLHSWQGEPQFCCSNQLNLYILSVKQVKLLFWF